MNSENMSLNLSEQFDLCFNIHPPKSLTANILFPKEPPAIRAEVSTLAENQSVELLPTLGFVVLSITNS